MNSSFTISKVLEGLSKAQVYFSSHSISLTIENSENAVCVSISIHTHSLLSEHLFNQTGHAKIDAKKHFANNLLPSRPLDQNDV